MVLIKKSYRKRGYKPRRKGGFKPVIKRGGKVALVPTKPAQSTQLVTVPMMKRFVGRGRENKMVSRFVMNNETFESPVTAIYPIIPQISQGTQDFQRIGETVQPKGLYFKMQLGLDSDAQIDNRPLAARVMVVSLKTVKNEQFLTSAFTSASARLLKYNDPVSGIIELPYGTQPYSNLPPINKDLFNVHMDKRVVLSPGHTSGGNSVEQLTKAQRFVSCKLKLPTLHFDSQVPAWGNYATNSCPFVIIGWEYTDGAAGETILPRLIANAWSFLYYEDA